MGTALRVLKARSLFRYYGVELLKEVDAFEAEFSQFVGASPATWPRMLLRRGTMARMLAR